MQLNVNDKAVTAFRELEKKVSLLEQHKLTTEKAMRESQDTYNNAKQGAVHKMNSWDALGPLHVATMKATYEYEQANKALTEAQGELQSAKPALMAEVVRAARDAVK